MGLGALRTRSTFSRPVLQGGKHYMTPEIYFNQFRVKTTRLTNLNSNRLMPTFCVLQ